MKVTHRFEAGVDVVECGDETAGTSLKVSVARKRAELVELTKRVPGRPPVAFLWRNGVVSPPMDGFWRRHAPILFPIVGGLHQNRSVTTGGQHVHFHGQHGFLRDSTLELLAVHESNSGVRLCYRLCADEETLRMYPWKYELDVCYDVSMDNLDLAITVTNKDLRSMPFQLGWHPGFRTPFAAGKKADCILLLPQGRLEQLQTDAECRLTGHSTPFDSKGRFPFSEEGLHGTYIFDVSALAALDRIVELWDPDGATGVKIAFPDCPHLGIWSDAGAPFLCIEPWQGADDRVVQEPFDLKFGMVLLAPGASETRCVRLQMIVA